MKEKRLFLTSLKQICNEYLIKFSENQSAPKLVNRKTSPCSPCAPNLLHVLVSRIPGYHNLCSPAYMYIYMYSHYFVHCEFFCGGLSSLCLCLYVLKCLFGFIHSFYLPSFIWINELLGTFGNHLKVFELFGSYLKLIIILFISVGGSLRLKKNIFFFIFVV